MIKKNNPLLYFSICVGIITLGFLLPHFSFYPPITAYAAAFVSTSLLFFLLCRLIFRADFKEKHLFILLIFALLVRFSYIFAPPVGSDDIYRYMWDGKVQSYGLNPYSYAPNSTALDHLKSNLLPASVNHPDLKTLYFPFSEWIFYTGYQISGETIWGYKLLLFLSEIATITGIFLLLKGLKQPVKYSLLYAFCPLPIFQFAIDCHLDGFGLPFLIFGILFYLNKKIGRSLLLLGLSISIKPIAVVLLPIFFLNEQTWRNRIKTLLVPLFIIVLQFVPYVLTSNPFESLYSYAKHWTFNGIVFEAVNIFYADNQKSRLICALLLMLILSVLFISKKQFHYKIFLSFFFILLLSPVVHPWYVAWLTVLIPFMRYWSAILFTGLVSLTSITIVNYKLYGIWEQYPAVLIIEYLPVIAFLLYELLEPQIENKHQSSMIDS